MITRTLNIGENRQEIPENTGRDFPLTIHYDDMRNWLEPRVDWHWHRELEFSVLLRGSLRVSTNHCEQTLRAGDGYFINRDVIHRVSAEPGEMPIMMTHLLDASLLAGAPMSVFDRKYIRPIVECHEAEMLPLRRENTRQRFILEQLQIAYDAVDSESEGCELLARNAYSAAWLQLMKEAAPILQAKKTVESPADRRVKQMLVFLRDNHGEKLALEDIARAANISTRECLRSFQQVLHSTPFQFLIDYRLRAAADDLLQTARSVTEIAMAHGFSSPGYFTKLFREKYGVTPTDYRKARNSGHE